MKKQILTLALLGLGIGAMAQDRSPIAIHRGNHDDGYNWSYYAVFVNNKIDSVFKDSVCNFTLYKSNILGFPKLIKTTSLIDGFKTDHYIITAGSNQKMIYTITSKYNGRYFDFYSATIKPL